MRLARGPAETGDAMAAATRDDVRALFVDMLVAASGSSDPRLARAFAVVPRELFLPQGPWTLVINGRNLQTPTDDPVHLYQNALVALDAEQGINNGEPMLHAAWLAAVAAQANEHVVHVGAGCGYYTALLSMLTLPAGRVEAFEVHARLAEAATRNLEPFPNVTVHHANAVEADLPACDVIYVNAGVVAPPLKWLEALRPGGRLIFPWRPTPQIGIAMLVTRNADGFACKPLMPSYFIPCVGAGESAPEKVPDFAGAWQSISLRVRAREAPDDTAVAIYERVWFSKQAL